MGFRCEIMKVVTNCELVEEKDNIITFEKNTIRKNENKFLNNNSTVNNKIKDKNKEQEEITLDDNLNVINVAPDNDQDNNVNHFKNNKVVWNNESTSSDNTDDSGIEFTESSSWDKSVNQVKEHAFAKLEQELRNVKETLKLRDEEVLKLSRIRQEVENELQELTASLFQEAHTMVREANLRQLAAERSMKESTMQVDVLSAEVSALKTLVLTSTPSKPNLHLHGHSKSKEDIMTSSGPCSIFRKHHRSPSHFDLKYGRESPPTESCTPSSTDASKECNALEVKDGFEIDPNVYREFVIWMEEPSLEQNNAFINRIHKEDIDQCLEFNNTILSAQVKMAINEENIFIEAVDKAKSHFPKKCALMEVPRLCFYRMRLGDNNEWHYISQICRNRIISVCNFLNYLRYIQRGLVKSTAHDIYWEITRLRKELILARLGFPTSTSDN